MGYKTSFRLPADDLYLGVGMANYAFDQLAAKRVAVIDYRTAYGAGIADVFAQTMQSRGLPIAQRFFVNTNDRNALERVASGISNVSPDVIFYGGMDAEAGPLLARLSQLGVRARFIGGDGICSDDLIRLSQGAIQSIGVYCAEANADIRESNTAHTRFAAQFKQRFETN